ncbi:sodium/proton-potassium antiporter GerN, CPA2 family (TC 2.A.37.2.2) [Thermoactinomyces sp. DSM 45891]|uniref:cation:proton antiporter n=1 Tax=Thermoactinomyces sp. DSM 45891 TaxID=1761907 RepID=UPI000921C168|nr:cation:proton antiporter [Thermoactinomyces sp. DSM 45891]SFX02124.1 sodium/proton-potassium antiporter GerN, CPA2 family (TC 2.A.37.2.2) [Thermoactinomyces sp. DSM 45891]
MLFVEILIILLATKIAGEISIRLGQPAVLGKLLIGIIIGPAVFGWIQGSDMIRQLSEIGVILLMFIAGLETDVKSLRQNRNSSIAVAVGGIIFPFLGGYLVGLGMELSQSHALFLGLLLSATSVSISAQTLKELGHLKSRESATILGAAVLDDIIVVIGLAVMMSLLTTEDVSLGMVLLKKLAFFVTIGLIGWKVVPWVMKKFSTWRVSESVVSTALVLCFFFSYLAESLGVAAIIGAFAAGVAISQTPYRHSVEQKIEPIAYAFFVPIFFVSIGLSVSFAGIGSQLWLIVGLTIIAVLTKLLGSGLGARLTGFRRRSALGIGAGMVSRGEVALIIAAIGLKAHLLKQEYFTSIITVVILTTLITPPLLKKVFEKLETDHEKVM